MYIYIVCRCMHHLCQGMESRNIQSISKACNRPTSATIVFVKYADKKHAKHQAQEVDWRRSMQRLTKAAQHETMHAWHHIALRLTECGCITARRVQRP